MSEDQPKQPSANPTPPPSSSTPTTSQTAEANQPFVKAQTIKVLRGTIQLLEGVVKNLEAEPPVQLPPTTLTSQGAVLEPSTETTQTPQAATDASSTPSVPATPSTLDRFRAFWNATLRTIRAVLPQSLNQKLSDTALSGVVAAVLVILLWTTTALLPGKQPAEVALAPSPTPSAEETPTPSAEETPTPSAEEAPPSPVAEAPTLPGIEAPPELEAPKAPEPIETAPPPPPVLTPEQSLIAAIQNQVGEVTSKYADGLIQSIEANFPESNLRVKVGEGWYNLNASQQDKLAAQMLQRSKELDFAHLEITDPQGTLIARSPVIGSQMVILKRQALAANL